MQENRIIFYFNSTEKNVGEKTIEKNLDFRERAPSL